MVNNPERGLPAADRPEGSKKVTSASRPDSPTRQMAALRARRVARLAREQAAVKRRVVMAAASSVLLLVFTVVAAVGALSWLWLISPVTLLVATVGSSVAGSFRAQSQSRDEVDELARIKDQVRATTRGNSRPSERTASSQSQAAESAKEDIEESLPVGASDEAARDDVESDVVVSEPTAPPSDVTQRPAREWNVISLPPVRGSHQTPVLTRRVHADTDLVPIQERRDAGVPARPLHKSDQVAAAAVAAAQVTGPTFRFDLDAVLDQRRAQSGAGRGHRQLHG